MANKKNLTKKGGRKKYTFQFSFRSLFLLSIAFLFVLGWVFSLGVMAGRGFLPNTMDILLSMKKKIAKNEEKKKYDYVLPIREEELSFYNQLIDKKDMAKKSAPVAPPPKEPDISPVQETVEPVNNHTGDYSIQVAALNDEGETEKIVKKLIKLGYQAYYYQTMVKGKVYYRVRCGPFSNKEEAKSYANKLAEIEGFKPFVVYPTNNNQ